MTPNHGCSPSAAWPRPSRGEAAVSRRAGPSRGRDGGFSFHHEKAFLRRRRARLGRAGRGRGIGAAEQDAVAPPRAGDARRTPPSLQRQTDVIFTQSHRLSRPARRLTRHEKAKNLRRLPRSRGVTRNQCAMPLRAALPVRHELLGQTGALLGRDFLFRRSPANNGSPIACRCWSGSPGGSCDHR